MDETKHEAAAGSSPAAAHAGSVLHRGTGAVERMLEHTGDRMWARLRKRPFIGVALAGGAGLAIASAVGVGEIAVALMAGYAAYQMLSKREPPSDAFRDAMKLERELPV